MLRALPARCQQWLSPRVLRRLSRLWLPLGREVVIIGADLAAVELAEFLAARGRRVHLLDSGKKIAPEVGKKRRHEHMDRLDALRVTVNTGVEIRRIGRTAVVIAAAGSERCIRADSIIVAGEPTADKRLAEALGAAGLQVQAIGDCTGLGLIAGATAAAAQAVAALEQPAVAISGVPAGGSTPKAATSTAVSEEENGL